MSHRRPAEKTAKTSEAELYPPVEKYFAAQGYVVKGEVMGCDLVAVRGNEVVVAELKLTFNIKLLYQAVRRLSLTPQVYAVILKPKGRQKMSYWQMMKSLCRRLNIGMLIVDKGEVLSFIEPAPFAGKVNARQKAKVLKEFNGRRAARNTGGVTGVKLETAYLETAVQISVLLKKHRRLSPAELVALGCSEKAGSILLNNFYGWFEKSERGVYQLKTGKARVIAKENPHIWQYYEESVEISGARE
ncbi:MAG: DUF2161 family putative PD-(D/E)XK-type phosphodiesterase [Turneriella sp.]